MADRTSLKAIVFDIQRFALHDGPGIRTTVFVKGCPLRCLWCHNPESQAYHSELSFDYDKCRECLAEGTQCPFGVKLEGEQIRHDRHPGFDSPEHQCPRQAVKIYGTLRTVEEVMAEVMADHAYYDRSGGGLTVSGGEPMSSFEWTLELCRTAKMNGIHVCLDTSGYAPRERFADIMPYVDLFLYDYKVSDPAQHRTLTGVSQDPILSNLDYLYRQGASVLLRCPLIPGVNDGEEHLSAIAELDRKYPNLHEINLMPYHNMGRDKAARIGKQEELPGIDHADEGVVQGWLEQLVRLGSTRSQRS
ncbi:hypothetical protein PWYN_04700 [Paenibacillus wynnii]|uniref:Radical SAM core domain-containing protein n=2 Tax=Paenibacillus wynnii TaxID=268407 RepID=A0A098M9L6_9BACL|nr:glycyl-radical enzyme activating protein [Paenibacillus wynnii]KGE18746.1 hypothetical protein PWYN_04700 [Paenibacillus wynnii]